MTTPQSPPREPLQPAMEKLARRLLWIAFCWNDHNFDKAHIEAR
jgi:hypothetical protein